MRSGVEGKLSAPRALTAFALALAAWAFAAPADAQKRAAKPARPAQVPTIKKPGERPAYSFEAEPHFVLGTFDPPGPGDDPGLGAGFRGTVEILSEGFIGSINDSVGVGFGVDFVRFGKDGARGTCSSSVLGPNNIEICTEVDGDDRYADYFVAPLVMQWNFWLTRQWSVFGEPGLAFYYHDGDLDVAPFVIWGGGRFHLSDTVSLTMRIGHPTLSVGVSFLL